MKRLLHFPKRIIAFLVALVLGMGTAFAYDFTSKCSTGQWLYYNIIDATNHYVELTYPSPDSYFPYGSNPHPDPSGEITLPEGVTYNGINYTVTAIGMRALYGCDGLTGSLVIPNTVTSIGQEAFKNCTGLTSMTVLPVTPPTLGSSVFEGVPATIPVYVPCGTLEDYQEAPGWIEAFTNMQTVSSTITVQAWPPEGGTVTGGGAYSCNETCTVSATPNSGYQFLHWSNNGTVVNCNASYTFTVGEDTDLEAVFMPLSGAATVVGNAVAYNEYLPSHSYYNYTLSQQIYTYDELGGSRTITSISFFNGGTEQTRNYTIYMAHTTKTVFSGSTDWIKPLSSNQVFSGSVTMKCGVWTTIVLDEPFAYDGTSNLALIVDDNTGSYNYGMSCRVYNAAGSQAIKIQSDGTNYNPLSPYSYEGALMTLKNQIILNRAIYTIAAAAADATAGTVSGNGEYGYGDPCRLKVTVNPGYTFMGWTDEEGVLVSTEEEYVFPVKTDKSLVANFVEGDDFCSLTFDLHDSFGDGWNGNYLVVDLGNGVTQQMAVLEGKKEASYTLPVVDGAHVVLNWIEGSWTNECSFDVRYSNGNIVCAKRNLDEYFTYEFDMDCEGMPSLWAYVGDHGEMTHHFFPSASFLSYTTTGQIYTASEIGTSGIINGIAFYNTGLQCTRFYDIYLTTTEKTFFAFSEITGGAPTGGSDPVFSGSVTMYSGKWTPIIFDTPFEYDGSSNLLVAVLDNTGEESSDPDEPDMMMTCLAYNTPVDQAIVYDADFGFPSEYKNQLLLDIRPATVTQTVSLASGANWFSTNLDITLDDLKAALVAAVPGTNITVKGQNRSTRYVPAQNKWVGSLNALDLTQMYIITVSADAEITLEGMPVNPAEMPITIKNGTNWIAFPLSLGMTLTDAFTGFAVNGDVVKGQNSSARCIGSSRWVGGLTTLEPGMGYLYNSAASGDRTFIFHY